MIQSIDTLISAFAGQFPAGGIEEQSLRIAYQCVVRGDMVTAKNILKYVSVPEQLKTQILGIYDTSAENTPIAPQAEPDNNHNTPNQTAVSEIPATSTTFGNSPHTEPLSPEQPTNTQPEPQPELLAPQPVITGPSEPIAEQNIEPIPELIIPNNDSLNATIQPSDELVPFVLPTTSDSATTAPVSVTPNQTPTTTTAPDQTPVITDLVTLLKNNQQKPTPSTQGTTIDALWERFVTATPTQKKDLLVQAGQQITPQTAHPADRTRAFEQLLSNVQTQKATESSGIIAPEANIPVIKTYAEPIPGTEQDHVTKQQADKQSHAFELLTAFVQKAIASKNKDLIESAERQLQSLKLRNPQFVTFYPEKVAGLEQLLQTADKTESTPLELIISGQTIQPGMTITGTTGVYTVREIVYDHTPRTIIFTNGGDTYLVAEGDLAQALSDDTVDPDAFFTQHIL